MIKYQKGQTVQFKENTILFYKGDEMVILVPNAHSESAQHKLHRLHGNQYIIMTQKENYDRYKDVHADKLYHIWGTTLTSKEPVHIYSTEEVVLVAKHNAEHAKSTLEVLE